MMKKMVENSRELALRRVSALQQKIGLLHWASGGSARLALRALKVLTSRQILPEPLQHWQKRASQPAAEY